MKQSPSMDQWLREAKASPDAGKIGMYLQHCGVVRETARARVRDGDENAPDVKAMRFSYDADKLEEIIAEGYTLPGIFYIKVWLAEGLLHPGDDIMRLLIGGDIRPNLVQALQHIVGRIKAECVEEEELS